MAQLSNDSLNNYYADPRLQQIMALQNNSAPTTTAPLPDLYNIPMDSYEKQGLKENLKKSDPSGLFEIVFNHPLAFFGSWLAFGYGMNKYADACGGNYETSLLNKAATFGDKIYNQKIWHSPTMNNIKETTNKGFGKIKKLLEKSDIFRAFKNSPVEPEWAIAKNMTYHTEEEIVCGLTNLLGKLKLTDTNIMQFNELGLKKDEIANLKKVFNVSNINAINKEKAINYTLLKRFGELSDNDIMEKIAKDTATADTKKYILEKLELNAEKIANLGKNPKENLVLARDVAQKASGKVWIGQGNYKILGPLTKPFERIISADYISNQFKSLSQHNKGGQIAAKIVQNTYRGLTFGGGKLGALIFIIPELIHGVINTKKADKDEKLGTAAWGFLRAISWVITFPISVKLLYNMAGIKFAGMSEKAIKNHENLIKAFNEKLQNGEFKDKNTYKTAKKELTKELKELRNVKQNLFTRTVRKVVSPLSMDLNVIKPFKNNSAIGNFIRKLPNFMKNCGAVPLKFFLCMMGIQSVLDSILHKGCNAIFGKNYDSEKENELKTKKQEQEKFTYNDLHQRLEKLQVAKQMTSSGAVPEQNEIPTENPFELNDVQKNNLQNKLNDIKQTEQAIINTNVVSDNPQSQQYVSDNTQNSDINNEELPLTSNNSENIFEVNKNYDNYTYIPSQNSVLNNKPKTDAAKYIPSQKPAQIPVQNDNSAMKSAFLKADKAEQKAMEILSGNYKNMQY